MGVMVFAIRKATAKKQAKTNPNNSYDDQFAICACFTAVCYTVLCTVSNALASDYTGAEPCLNLVVPGRALLEPP